MAQKTSQIEKIEQLNQKLRENQQILDRLAHSAAEADTNIDRLGKSLNQLKKGANGKNININLKQSRESASGSSGSSNRIDKSAASFNKMLSLFGSSQISSTASKLSSTMNMLSSSSIRAVGYLGALVSALGAITAITVKANSNTLKYAQSLRSLNKELTDSAKIGYNSANELGKLKNNWETFMQTIGESLEGVLGDALKIINQGKGAEPLYKYSTTKADIAANARQVGFSANSAENLGINTYGWAELYAENFSIPADKISEFAKTLEDAWRTGSDAAKAYGVVVNDDVLTGYLWEQGIDIANVEITDAMKEYYRYELMLKQLSKEVSQEDNKRWTQLGFMIDKTKGKLFSFDEVIQLTAADATIPEVEKAFNEITDTSMPGGDKGTDTSGVPAALVPPNVPGAASVPVEVDVVNPGAIPALEEALASIPSPTIASVEIPVHIPEESVENMNSLHEKLNILGLTDWTATVNANVPGMVPLNETEGILSIIDKTPWEAMVSAAVPGMGIITTTLGLLSNIGRTWLSQINVSVIGGNLLEKVEALLERIRGLFASLGQSVGSPITVTGSHVYSSWAPQVSQSAYEAAYGSGLGGAFAADWDAFKTRMGFQSQTKTGITTGQYADATWNFMTGSAGKEALAAIAGLALVNAPALASAGAKAGAGIKAGASSLWAWLQDIMPFYIESGSTAGGLLASAGAFADGGIGTKEIHNATLFEGGKKEAVIPLETEAGINYLSDAIEKAGGQGGGLGEVHVHLTLSGINIADDDAQWEMVGKKIGEVIEVQKQRRGDLNYGSSF